MNWIFHPYTLPLARPYAWAKGTETVRRGLLVACTVDRVTGWGEVAPAPHQQVDPRQIASFARKSLRVALAQEDVPAALDAANCGARLRSGIAGAWLDAQAQIKGQSLGRFVAERIQAGQVPAERVPVNALITVQSPAECAKAAAAAVAEGFQTLKLKSDGDRDADVERLGAVRDAVGNYVSIRLDANESYPVGEASAILRRLAPFDLEYVEQPVPAAERDAIVRLLQEAAVPIALDESVVSWQAVAPLAHLRPVLILKPQRLGGIDRTAALIAKANRAGLRCIVTNSLETAVGRAHALHAAALLPEPARACGLATAGFLARDVAPDAAPTERGWQSVPAGPGLGVVPTVEVGDAAAVE